MSNVGNSYIKVTQQERMDYNLKMKQWLELMTPLQLEMTPPNTWLALLLRNLVRSTLIFSILSLIQLFPRFL